MATTNPSHPRSLAHTPGYPGDGVFSHFFVFVFVSVCFVFERNSSTGILEAIEGSEHPWSPRLRVGSPESSFLTELRLCSGSQSSLDFVNGSGCVTPTGIWQSPEQGSGCELGEGGLVYQIRLRGATSGLAPSAPWLRTCF